MRVIAGRARGTRLARPPGGTRPLSDRAREGLFSTLGSLVVGARCADLFAGTGAIGIEALSRGAASCRFVDSNPAAIRSIRANLTKTHLEESGLVTRADVVRFLSRSDETYDLVFLDPPYALAKGKIRATLTALEPRLASGGTYVLTRPSRNSIDVIPIHFTARTYGDTRILICTEEP